MQFTEKYRPRNYDEYVGSQDKLHEIEEYVESGKPVILIGPPGCGKTTAVFLVASTLGYEVVRTNASDERRSIELKDLQLRLSTKTFTKTLFFIDEADGVQNQNFLFEIVNEATNPVILAANDGYRLSKNFTQKCKVIDLTLENKDLYGVIKRMRDISKTEGKKVSFEKVSTDVRSTINTIFYGADGYEPEKNSFEKVEAIFKNGEFFDINPIWLIDNVHNFYYGLDLYEAIRLISLYMETGKREFLGFLKRAKYGKAEYPNFYKKLKKNGYHR